MNRKTYLSAFLYSAALTAVFSVSSYGQERPRVIISDPIKKTISSEPINRPPSQSPQPTVVQKSNLTSRPVLTNQIVVVGASKAPVSLVKKTGSSVPTGAVPTDPMRRTAVISPLAVAFNQRLTQAMDSKLGIRYVYGSTGPYTYDCSGLVWSVFQEAGLNFTRSSARTYWQEFEPVSGDDRYKFGTLVFFNGLGHVGIVVDDKGFYHASSSKGVTYSSFEGYWAKRIVGFRRIPESMMPYNSQNELLQAEGR